MTDKPQESAELNFDNCDKCEKNKSQNEHTCPYKVALADDNDIEVLLDFCNCCEECEYQCGMNI